MGESFGLYTEIDFDITTDGKRNVLIKSNTLSIDPHLGLEFDYKKIPKKLKEESKIDIQQYQKEKWYLNVWQITNVLPINNRLEKGIAAFPEEIPYRLIKLFSYKGEIVLDPFIGSGTTLKVAIELGRKAVGYEIDIEILNTIKEKLKINQPVLIGNASDFEIIIREDVKRLRTQLQKKVAKNNKKR